MTIAATHITAAAIQKYNALSITVVFLQHGASSVPYFFFLRGLNSITSPTIQAKDIRLKRITEGLIIISFLFIINYSKKQSQHSSDNCCYIGQPP